MTKVIVKPAADSPRIFIKSQGTQGVSGASFRVVNASADLIPSFGNHSDTAITINDGCEYRKSSGIWSATGRRFWGTLLEDTQANADASAISAGISEASAVASDLSRQQSELYASDSAAAAYASEVSSQASGAYAISAANSEAMAANHKEDAERAAAQTASDKDATGLNLIASNAAKSDTEAAAAQAVLDAQSTSEDRVAVASDRIATYADKQSTAADRIVTGEDREQTGLDVTQTGEDRSAVAQDKADVEAAVEILRTVDGVYIWQSNGQPIPVGGYIATASAETSGVFDRMSLSIPSGGGSTLVQLVVNGQPVGLAVEVSAGSPVNLIGQSINISQGDSVVFAVLIGTASQLWAQITGLLK